MGVYPWASSLAPDSTVPFSCLEKTGIVRMTPAAFKNYCPEHAPKASSLIGLGHLPSKYHDLVAKLIVWNLDMNFPRTPVPVCRTFNSFCLGVKTFFDCALAKCHGISFLCCSRKGHVMLGGEPLEQQGTREQLGVSLSLQWTYSKSFWLKRTYFLALQSISFFRLLVHMWNSMENL